ncbi:hypothetical protein NKH84_29630 [Mesorhizobium sp. M0902]
MSVGVSGATVTEVAHRHDVTRAAPRLGAPPARVG